MTKLSSCAAMAGASLWIVPLASAQVKDVDVTGGKVSALSPTASSHSRAIPFAAPPVGALRWKAPQPVKPWTGVKQAFEYSASCMQDPNFREDLRHVRADQRRLPLPQRLDAGENPGDKLPVMVWIYGGGFAAGMTSVPPTTERGWREQGIVWSALPIGWRVRVSRAS